MSALRHPRRAFASLDHRRKVAVIVVGLCLLLASGGLAYYLATLSATGSASGTAPLAANPTADISAGMNVAVPAGLKPGQSGQVVVASTNPAASAVSVGSVTPGAITTSVPACLPSWFSLGPNTHQMPQVIPSHDGATIGSFLLTFVDSGGDQTACSGATITVPVTVP